MKMFIREIKKSDIKDILDIRVSTKENHFSMTDLAEVGVTPESVAEWLDGSLKDGFAKYPASRLVL